MGKRRRIVWGGLIVAVVGVIGWVVWRSSEPPEPFYKGKPLSFWLEECVQTNTMRNTALEKQGFDQAHEALTHIGTNAIPTLLRLLRAQDSHLKLKLIALFEKQHIVRINYFTADRRNSAGFNGLLWLGPSASNAVPALIELFGRDYSSRSQFLTVVALGQMGPTAAAAVPALTHAATNADVTIRDNSIIALGSIHAKPELAVPVLTKSLKDSDPHVRWNAVLALGNFGAAAKPAVPDMIDVMNNLPPTLKDIALRALRQIDSEAAARVSANGEPAAR